MDALPFVPPLCKPATFKAAILALIFAFCAGSALAQPTQTQPAASPQPKPVSLPHLYWHFLIHQSDLDAAAAKLQSEGKDGSALRNDLQNRLGFSDADYAPIRTSSQRLASELQPINQQLRALQSSPGNTVQIQALTSELESCIGNEVYNLSLELSAQNKAALEAFMAQFFAPKQLTFQVSASAAQSSSLETGKAAQQ